MARYGDRLFEEDDELYEKRDQENVILKMRENAQRKLFKKRRDSVSLERDNLRFKALAQYRVISDGDVLRYEMIEDNLLAKALVKGLATQEQSIEDFEACKEKDYFMPENLSVEGSDEYERADDNSDDRNERRKQRKRRRRMRKDILPFPRPDDKEDSEKDRDIHSSLDYWQEIEPRVNQGAEILDFSVAAKKDHEALEEAGPDVKVHHKRPSAPAAAGHQNIQDMIVVRELKKELELERKSNAQREKNSRALAKKYTLEFFREKSAQIQEKA